MNKFKKSKMNKYFFRLSLLFLLVVNGLTAFSQQKKYLVYFTDKKYNNYSVDKPQKFLSLRAIERRTKQHVLITEQDLPVSDLYVTLIKSAGVQVISKSKWMNAILIASSDDNQISEIRNYLFVKKIKEISSGASASGINKFETELLEPYLNEAFNPFERSDVYNYGLSRNQAEQINVICMHNNGYNGNGLIIAVLDAGFFNVNILPAFDSLRSHNQILGCRDFVTGDTMVYEDNQHGMMVLSSMGGNLPGRLVGTAPNAKYWLIRTEDAATESLQEEINWLVGAEFADSVGADIINSSLGYSTFDNSAENHTYADMDGNTTIVTKAADWAASKGIFVCSSAGNAAGYPWFKITAPADADSILTVGAVDSAGFVTGFSSRGPTFDGRIKPNVAAKGYQSVVAAPWGDILQGNGTSFSSPITAGAVACLWQANPSKTNMELVYAIQQSANQASAPDTLIGYGIPDFCLANTLLTDITQYERSSNVLAIYPNPFSSDFSIEYTPLQSEAARIEVIDISGRIIFSETNYFKSNDKNKITSSALNNSDAGMYFVKIINSKNEIISKKIIKN